MVIVSLTHLRAPHAPLRDSGARVSEASSEEAEEARSDIARLSWCKGKARSAGILSNAAASVLPWSGFVQDEVSSVPG
jgi:hypothetical protein